MPDLHTILIAVLAAAGSWVGCLVLVRLLAARGVLDVPVDRSSHSTPTPRGGGLAVIAVILLFSVILGLLPWSILIPLTVLAAIGWIDDVYSMPPLPRFSAQLISVFGALYFSPSLAGIPGFELPVIAGGAIIALGWIWFVNLYNFMDGIDGITGVETVSISIGVIAVASVSALADQLVLPACIIGAAALGFLIVNWHPAKIFLGDVGSIPLGFILGWLLLELAHSGDMASAIILPMYYLADATITLFKRLIRGEKPWRAHKEHFYQRAHQAGLSHSAISIRILTANAGLIALAVIAAMGHPLMALIAAMVLTAGMLFHLGSHGKHSA